MSSTKPEYVKLVEIALIKGLVSMEDEQLFNKLNFIKTKIHNWLTNHLDLFVHMFEQSIFSMDKFPFDEAMHIWYFEKYQSYILKQQWCLSVWAVPGRFFRSLPVPCRAGIY